MSQQASPRFPGETRLPCRSVYRLLPALVFLFLFLITTPIAVGQDRISEIAVSADTQQAMTGVKEILQDASTEAAIVDSMFDHLIMTGTLHLESGEEREHFRLVFDENRWRVDVDGEETFARFFDGLTEYRVNPDGIGIVNQQTHDGPVPPDGNVFPWAADRYVQPLSVTINMPMTVAAALQLLLQTCDEGGDYQQGTRILRVQRDSTRVTIEDDGMEESESAGRTSFRIVLDAQHGCRLLEFSTNRWTTEGRDVWEDGQEVSVEYDPDVGGGLLPAVGRIHVYDRGRRAEERGGPFDFSYSIHVDRYEIAPTIPESEFALTGFEIQHGTLVSDSRFVPKRYYRYSGTVIEDVNDPALLLVPPHLRPNADLSGLDGAAVGGDPTRVRVILLVGNLAAVAAIAFLFRFARARRQ